MKVMVYVLILANLAFFLWQFQHGDLRRQPSLQIEESAEKQILLLSEVPEAAVLVADKGADIPEQDKGTADNRKTAGTKVLASVSKTLAAASTKDLKQVPVQPDEKPMPEVSIHNSIKDVPAAVEQGDELSEAEAIGNNGESAVARPLPRFPAQTDDEGRVEIDPVHSPDDQEVVNGVTDSVQTKIDKNTDAASQPFSGSSIESTTAENAQTGLSCFEVGPFVNEAEAQAWLKDTDNKTKNVHLSVKPVQEISNYLVYLPAPETFAQARDNVTMLKGKGITDLWLFRKGELKGAVSLGMFKVKSRADKLVAMLHAKELQVAVAERYHDVEKWFVRYHSDQPISVILPLQVQSCDSSD